MDYNTQNKSRWNKKKVGNPTRNAAATVFQFAQFKQPRVERRAPTLRILFFLSFFFNEERERERERPPGRQMATRITVGRPSLTDVIGRQRSRRLIFNWMKSLRSRCSVPPNETEKGGKKNLKKNGGGVDLWFVEITTMEKKWTFLLKKKKTQFSRRGTTSTIRRRVLVMFSMEILKIDRPISDVDWIIDYCSNRGQFLILR